MQKTVYLGRIPLELRHLRHFVGVAEELHFGRAALRLHIEQSPLSRSIKELERDLGIKLFERTTRSTRLTVAGKVFLNEARRVLNAAEQARSCMTRAAMASRESLCIAPLYPLRDSKIINFCSQLPIQHRINKTLFEHLLSARLKNNSFSNYPKETFMHADETSLLRQKASYILKCDNFKVVDIGLIDSKTLKQDLELINRQTPRYIFDYLLNILAIERFLEAYL